MIIEIISMLMVLFFVFLLATIFHEFGHLAMMWIYKKRPRIKFSFRKGITIGDKYDYLGLNKMQYIAVMMSGIAMGMLPLLFLSKWWFIITMTLYLAFGCRSDIVGMARDER
jgi:hypothetical protein